MESSKKTTEITEKYELGIINTTRNIGDLVKCEIIKRPSIFTKNKNLIAKACRKFTTKTVELLKREIRDIEICYDAEGTGFNVFISLDRKKRKVISVDWNLYNNQSPPKSCFSTDEKRFYNTRYRLERILVTLNYKQPTELR
jgi:hypothetical protein